MLVARAEELEAQANKDNLTAELQRNIARLEDELAQKDAKDRAGSQVRKRPQPRAIVSISTSKADVPKEGQSVQESSKFLTVADLLSR